MHYSQFRESLLVACQPHNKIQQGREEKAPDHELTISLMKHQLDIFKLGGFCSLLTEPDKLIP